MGKLKIGVFGAHRGMTMIQQLLHHPDATVCAICDKHRPSLESAGKAADEAGVRVELFEDFEQFIQADMDAAVLPGPDTARRSPGRCSSGKRGCRR